MNRTGVEGLVETFSEGYIGRDGKGLRLQDAWVRGIDLRLTDWQSAWWTRKRGAPWQRATLERARLASPLIPVRTMQDRAPWPRGCIGAASVGRGARDERLLRIENKRRLML
jgi:hypothetical protein